MQKICRLLLVFLSVFVLGGCNKGMESVGLDLEFSEYFGLTIEEYLKTTNTSAEVLKESLPGIGVWQFANKITYKENEFIKFLHVDTTANIIYGGGYQCVIQNPDESTFELVNSIKQDLINQFGEPITYEGLDNALSNMKNFFRHYREWKCHRTLECSA